MCSFYFPGFSSGGELVGSEQTKNSPGQHPLSVLELGVVTGISALNVNTFFTFYVWANERAARWDR